MNRCVTLAFVGDIRLGAGIQQDLCWRSSVSFWDGALPIFQQAQAVFANLEGEIEATVPTVSEVTLATGNSFPSETDFSAPATQLLQAANIQFVSLANNHTLDWTHQRLGNTMQSLDAAQIAYAGAGTTAIRAALPIRLNIASLETGILAYSGRETPSLQPHSGEKQQEKQQEKQDKNQHPERSNKNHLQNHSYVNTIALPKIRSNIYQETLNHTKEKQLGEREYTSSKMDQKNGKTAQSIHGKNQELLNHSTDQPSLKEQLDPTDFPHSTLNHIEQTIKRLRNEGVELIILSIHWGPSLEISPSKEFRSLAHRLIDLGVDILHGHGTHIFQAVEVYHRKLILYNTGDILSDAPIDPRIRNDWSFIFLVDLDREGIQRLRMVPVHLHYANIELAKHEVFDAICHRMQSLCAEFQTEAIRTQEGLVVDVCHPSKHCLYVS